MILGITQASISSKESRIHLDPNPTSRIEALLRC